MGFPSQKLKIIGVTGTKGKTTTVFLIEHLLKNLSFKTALLSTVHNKILDTIVPTSLTTQHPDYLHVFFQECVNAHVDYVVMEVAAQAVSLHRVYGMEFDALVFTNFAQEHGEFYPTMHEYFSAKCALLEQRKKDAPVLINADDERCEVLLKNNYFFSFGINSGKTYFLTGVFCGVDFIQAQFYDSRKKETTSFASPLIGHFNAYNILAALSVCVALGHSLEKLVQALETFFSVPGRLELHVLPNKARCFIDYAHNPSSYSSVLSTLRDLTSHLIVVCGAGGDRDKTKRPLMGALAAEYADIVIFTSDNPRSEDPAIIIQEMITGVEDNYRHKISVVLDREEAIKKAYAFSTEKSMIALLGKGPDHYQLIKGQKLYFNEAEILKNL